MELLFYFLAAAVIAGPILAAMSGFIASEKETSSRSTQDVSRSAAEEGDVEPTKSSVSPSNRAVSNIASEKENGSVSTQDVNRGTVEEGDAEPTGSGVSQSNWAASTYAVIWAALFILSLFVVLKGGRW